MSGKVTRGVLYCSNVNILFHSDIFSIETNDFRCNSRGTAVILQLLWCRKKLPSWPKRFFRASGQGLVTTSPTSAWCQQEKLSHMPGQPVKNTNIKHTIIKHVYLTPYCNVFKHWVNKNFSMRPVAWPWEITISASEN